MLISMEKFHFMRWINIIIFEC